MFFIKTIINNLHINYIKKGKGKNLLIIPGWGTTINTYMPLIESLSKDYTVYSLDMPGFGLSEEPPNPWNIDDYVVFINSFLKKLKIKSPYLIGHSNGGRIIIKMMSQKQKIKCSKIVLISSAGIVSKMNLTKKIKQKIFKLGKKLITNTSPNLLNHLKKHFGSDDYKKASPTMRETLIKLVNEDLKAYLEKINVPTLLIWGTKDTATPLLNGITMENKIPQAKLIKIENCTHYVYLEKLPYVAKIITEFFEEEK